ncbi:Mitochondrial intermembrane space import and assembly protein 40 [Gracilariopsis chorda]|uniref:Mitochondrial intermembrane space import and assembly protein 40 n=1 Tax=Gracilariopsis chorda TaxID=448386 RepID=A0A2V3IJF6_9FLOR|nr:Mitochondrial intermembrane space import and assembly protein 40 [Gracilariopsis chorda]|eukprot:PXF41260.1 Mitochondrial intermembrane space import and assembly protein 40 [Gracilariopsis chorda]
MQPQRSSDSASDSEPEVFAASASESAITSGKAESSPPDLPTLSEDLQYVVREEEKQQGLPSANSDSPASTEPGSAAPASTEPAALPDQDVTKSDKDDETAQQLDSDSAEERQLSKEELIEEALNCPCIASMKEGSCGDSFIDAYKCFLQSETEPKGMDCMEQFQTMQSCLAEHPEEYNLDDDDDDANPFAAATGNDQTTEPQPSQETPSA